MEKKFYIKRNINNQIAKVTKDNILFLDPEFKDEFDEINLSSVLRGAEEKYLGDFFQHSRFSKLPIAATLVKKFTLGTLYEVKDITVEEFSRLPLTEKFKFIISQKLLIWLNYLNKQELFDFLNYCNVNFNSTASFNENKKLAITYIKQLQRYKIDKLYESDEDNHDQTFGELDIKTALEPQNNNTSKSNDEITCLTNILTDLNTQLINNKTEVIDNTLTIEQINQFNKTENSFQPDLNINKINIKKNMAGHHNFSPGIFNGAQDECVLEFFENFELMAKANGWGDEEKLVYLPLYLKGSAYKLFKIMDSETKLSFEKIMLKFKDNFASYSRSKMLKNKLRNRKLKSGESVGEFWIDMIFLINETNKAMPESEKIDLILDALSPDYYNVIGMLKNNSLLELENNLKKLEYTKSRAAVLEEKTKLENNTYNSNNNNNSMKYNIDNYNYDNYNNHSYRRNNGNGNYSGPRFNNYKPPFFDQKYNNNYRVPNYNVRNNNSNMNYNNTAYVNGYNNNNNNYNRRNNAHNFDNNGGYARIHNGEQRYDNNNFNNFNNNMHMQNCDQKIEYNTQNKNLTENPPKTDIVCYGCGLPGHVRSSCTFSKN